MLQRLQVIQHPAIKQLIQDEMLPAINNAIWQRVDAFKGDATMNNFDDAEKKLKLLTEIKNNLPGVALSFSISALNRHLECCREQYAEQQRMEIETRERELTRLGEELVEMRNKKVRLPFPYN